MTPSSYWTQRRIRALRDGLADRELAIVKTLALVRLATGSQICRLHFAAVPSAPRQCRRSLARLVDLGVLKRYDRVTGGRGGGSESYGFALDVGGQALAGLGGPAHGDRPRAPWLPGPGFVRHTLAVAEVYVRLVEAEQAGGRELIEFAAEPLCWQDFLDDDYPTVLKPDALVRLGSDAEFEDAWLLEVDLATEHRPALERKLAAYAAHWRDGTEQRNHGGYPQVLWLVPDADRRDLVRDLIERRTDETRRVHLVHLFEDGVPRMQAEAA